MGTSLTAQQVAQARRYASSLIINYDGDEAGLKAALRAVPICLQTAEDQGLDSARKACLMDFYENTAQTVPATVKNAMKVPLFASPLHQN
jgi:hypothetical protein